VAVVSMSKQEFSSLEVLPRLQSGRLRVTDACELTGLAHSPTLHADLQIGGVPLPSATRCGLLRPLRRETKRNLGAAGVCPGVHDLFHFGEMLM
jgi:hypothetical protein